MPNGSRIIGLPGTEATIGDLSAVSLLLIDEAARVEDALYKSLLPMLAVANGDLWLMSTPYLKRGLFYESWEYGGDKWHLVSVTATECPRIPKDFLEDQRAEQGPAWIPGAGYQWQAESSPVRRVSRSGNLHLGCLPKNRPDGFQT